MAAATTTEQTHSPTKRNGRQAKATDFQTGSSFYLGQKKVHHTLREGLLSSVFSGNVPVDLSQRSAYKLISDSIQFSTRANHHRKIAFKRLLQSEPAAQGRCAGHRSSTLEGAVEWQDWRRGWEESEQMLCQVGPGRDSRHPEDVGSRSWVGTLSVVSSSSSSAGPIWGWRVGQLH